MNPDLPIQSQLCLPLDQGFMKNAWKCVKILTRVFKIQILDVFCIKSWKNTLFRSAEGSKLNCHQLSGEVAMFLSKWQWFVQNIGDENLWWHKIGLKKKTLTFNMKFLLLCHLHTVSENEYGTPWLRVISFCPFEALPKEKMTQTVYHFKALI